MMSCEKSYLNRIHRTAFLLDTEYIDIIRGNNQNAYTRKRKILLPHIFMQMLLPYPGWRKKQEKMILPQDLRRRQRC